jgi:hypothetical protein
LNEKTAKNGCWLQAFKKNLDFLCPNSHIFFMIIKAIVHPAEEGGFWAEVPAFHLPAVSASPASNQTSIASKRFC